MKKQQVSNWQKIHSWCWGFFLLCFSCIFCFGVVYPGLAAPSKEQSTAQQINENLVYEIKVDDEINGSMENYVARAYAEAEADQAAYMLLVLDTYGGYLDNAVNIKQIIVNSSVQTICFVNDKAISAGALIALACDEIIMAPGSTMGAAEPKVNGEKADEKTVSFWSAELSSTAELHDRNGLIAAAMADSDIEIENVVEKGKLLTLTADQAVDLGMADGEEVNEQLVLEHYGLGDAVVIQCEPDFQENLAGWLSSPVVSTILLTIGIAAIILEILFTGFGVAGIIGVISLVLYFAGGFLVGYAGWLTAVFVLLAVVLILLEIFVIPGFGIAGFSGLACLVISVISVAPTVTIAIGQIVFAIVVVIILVVISLKTKKTRRIWSRLILKDSTSTEEGYVSQPQKINEYLGKEGVALTTLRPAGAAKIGEERVDVVTEGNFIEPGEPIVVIKVDGSSIIVRKKTEV